MPFIRKVFNIYGKLFVVLQGPDLCSLFRNVDLRYGWLDVALSGSCSVPRRGILPESAVVRVNEFCPKVQWFFPRIRATRFFLLSDGAIAISFAQLCFL